MATVEELTVQVAALSRRIAVTEGALAIQALKARYSELVDRRFSKGAVVDAATLTQLAHDVAALFTPEGVWDGGPGLGTATGRRAIAERLREPTLVFSRHFFMNPRIDVQGETAFGRWDLLSPCRRVRRSVVLDVGVRRRRVCLPRRCVAAPLDATDDGVHDPSGRRLDEDLRVIGERRALTTPRFPWRLSARGTTALSAWPSGSRCVSDHDWRPSSGPCASGPKLAAVLLEPQGRAQSGELGQGPPGGVHQDEQGEAHEDQDTADHAQHPDAGPGAGEGQGARGGGDGLWPPLPPEVVGGGPRPWWWW